MHIQTYSHMRRSLTELNARARARYRAHVCVCVPVVATIYVTGVTNAPTDRRTCAQRMLGGGWWGRGACTRTRATGICLIIRRATRSNYFSAGHVFVCKTAMCSARVAHQFVPGSMVQPNMFVVHTSAGISCAAVFKTNSNKKQLHGLARGPMTNDMADALK